MAKKNSSNVATKHFMSLNPALHSPKSAKLNSSSALRGLVSAAGGVATGLAGACSDVAAAAAAAYEPAGAGGDAEGTAAAEPAIDDVITAAAAAAAAAVAADGASPVAAAAKLCAVAACFATA